MAVRRHPLLLWLGFGLILFTGSPQLAIADGSSYSYKVTHSRDRVPHHGVLTIDGSGVSYSEPEDRSDNFHFSCGDFLSGTSLKKGQHGWFLHVPVRWRDRVWWVPCPPFPAQRHFQWYPPCYPLCPPCSHRNPP